MTSLGDYIADPDRRARLARDTGYSPDYLWQIATGWRNRRASIELATLIETATEGAVPVETVRPDLPWIRLDGRPLVDAVTLAQRRGIAA